MAGLILSGLFAMGGLQPAFALPQAQEITPPETRALDLAAAALGWSERSNGGSSIVHQVTNGDITTRSLMKWQIYDLSYYYYAGNQHGIPFGDTEGYQWSSGCTAECNPPTASEFFQFNFDMNYDGDNNLDTPGGRYLGFFCEVTVIAPAQQLIYPTGEAANNCSVLLKKATQLRKKLEIPACLGVVCPPAYCDGNTRFYEGACDPKTGQCNYSRSEDCGNAGCNPGTSQCNPYSTDLCQGETCDPFVCSDNFSLSDPVCNIEDGTCSYLSQTDCLEDGCNPDSGKCNSSGDLCGGSLALVLVPFLILLAKRKA